MTNEQLYLAIGVPMLFNAAVFGAAMLWANAKFDRIEAKFDAKLEAINRRFDDMRELWRPPNTPAIQS